MDIEEGIGHQNDTRVEILGGISEIGYSMVLISTAQARVLMDMGLRNVEGSLLQAPAAPRQNHELVDLLRAEVLRPLPGFYDPVQLAADPQLAAAAFAQPDPRPSAIALSHAHIDHEGALGFARPEIPVYATRSTAQVLEAMERSGEERGGHSVRSQPQEPGEALQIGDLTVEFLPVDHDVPGAAGILLTTPTGTLAYTGDLNFHRNGGHLSRAFTERIRGVDMLVTETTMLSTGLADRPAPRSEDEVDAVFTETVRDSESLVLVSLYPRDVERAQRIIDLLGRLGRILVWPTQHAAFLAAMGLTGLVTWAQDRPERSPQPVPEGVQRVSLAAVAAEPSKFVVQPDAQDMPALADLPLTPGDSVWLHSQGEPLGPFVFGWELFLRWLEELGVTMIDAGSSGHAPAADLIEFVEAAQPKTVVPIHGFTPEALQVSVPTLLPRYGDSYRLDGTLAETSAPTLMRKGSSDN